MAIIKDNFKLKMCQDEKIKFELEGKTDDLLFVNADNKIKATRLVMLDEHTNIEESEIIDIAITSVSNNGKHEYFDKLMGKTIKVTVEEV